MTIKTQAFRPISIVRRFVARCAVGFCAMCGCMSGVSAETFTLLERERDLVETGADNSLVRDRTLFRLRRNGNYVTTSTATNIHSHYRANRAGRFKNYSYTGMFRIMETGGGVGVTFYSDYPSSDTYYRLRMFGGGSFHIAPHPDGANTLTGTTDTLVIPQPQVWQHFRIVVRTLRARTRIRAKVWPRGSPQPRSFQVDCEDAGDNRIRRGKPGVWALGTGAKQWKNLKVITP